MGVVGIAVTLLRLVQEVGKGVENINQEEGVGRGGGSITTPKKEVAIEAWRQRGRLNRLPKSIIYCTKLNLKLNLEPYQTINLITDSTEPR